jgi:RND family efflux transporter MFP subunit
MRFASPFLHLARWTRRASAASVACASLLTVPLVTAQPARAPEVAPVIVSPSSELSDSVTLDVLGSGLAQRSVTLFPQVEGEVTRVLFRTGQSVRAGQLLLQLDDRAQRLAVDLAAARLETANLLARRFESAGGTGAVPEIEVEEAVAARRNAQIELAQARQALDELKVNAPFAGVVGIAAVELGDRVSPSSAITTLDDRRNLVVEFSLPEAYLARLKPGQPVQATSPAYPGAPIAGTVREVDSRIDATLRTVRVRATLPNADDQLRSGMSFQVRLVLAGEPRISVPELALQFDRDGPFVWAVREGKAEAVPARVLRRAAGRVLIDSALRAGEPVVVEGVQRLRPGRAVSVVGERNAAETR